MTKAILPLVVLVAFTAFTGVLVADDGYFGFVRLAMRDDWALQMLLDVTISVGLFVLWMVPDARARGITPWPYVAACVALGSIGALAYLVHRGLKSPRAAVAAATAQS